MNIIGIVCEYNPFHNGHLYHLNKIKELYPDSLIILVMSGSVTERGDLSLINKWDKTDIALHYGVDLVVELPYKFSLQSADTFCYGSMNILNTLVINKIVFGSECNDINKLKKIAKIQLDNKDYNNIVNQYMKDGLNYPTALSNSINDIVGDTINTPNDILGLGYIKEIIKNNYNIEPICIKRDNDYNSLELNNICSASAIRNALYNKEDISKYVPKYSYSKLNNIRFLEDYYPYIKYKIITEINNLNKYHLVDEKIIPRIQKYIYESNTLDELVHNIKSKNYTYNKIKRMLVHILMSYTKEEHNNKLEYIRILGFNSNGRKYLNSIKKNINIPILTKYDDKYLNIESRITNIINLKVNELEEYKYKPIIKD